VRGHVGVLAVFQADRAKRTRMVRPSRADENKVGLVENQTKLDSVMERASRAMPPNGRSFAEERALGRTGGASGGAKDIAVAPPSTAAGLATPHPKCMVSAASNSRANGTHCTEPQPLEGRRDWVNAGAGIRNVQGPSQNDAAVRPK
jgi:hypothetical protein